MPECPIRSVSVGQYCAACFYVPHDTWALMHALGFSRARLRPLGGGPAAGPRCLDITQQLQQVPTAVDHIVTCAAPDLLLQHSDKTLAT